MALDDKRTGSEAAAVEDAALAELRSTLKWLIGAAGATAAAVVATVNLDDLSSLGAASVGLVTASAVSALTAALFLLGSAARVLTLPSISATEMSNREMEASIATLRPGDPIPDDTLAWIREHRGYLLGRAASVTELFTTISSAREVQEQLLQRAAKVEWQGRTLDPDSEIDRGLVISVIDNAQARLTLTERAVHYWRSQVAFAGLVDRLALGGVVFVVSVAILVAVPALSQGEAEGVIDSPISVQVYVRDPITAGLEGDCPDKLTGMVVGGTLAEPTIALPRISASCPAQMLDPNEGIVAVPESMP